MHFWLLACSQTSFRLTSSMREEHQNSHLLYHRWSYYSTFLWDAANLFLRGLVLTLLWLGLRYRPKNVIRPKLIFWCATNHCSLKSTRLTSVSMYFSIVYTNNLTKLFVASACFQDHLVLEINGIFHWLTGWQQYSLKCLIPGLHSPAAVARFPLSRAGLIIWPPCLN